MTIVRVLKFAPLLGMLTGCSTLVEGSTQYLRVETNPNRARCTLQRAGLVIGTIPVTPGAVTVEKTKDDIQITCAKDGYLTAIFVNHSGVATATYGNVLLGGVLGWAIDSASGADNRYAGSVMVNLVQKPWDGSPP